MTAIPACRLCPRRCGTPRKDDMEPGAAPGFCRVGSQPVLARAMLHQWEEPCISGTRGSGAVFFTGCVLSCVFCQNEEISQRHKGIVLSEEELTGVFARLAKEGAHNLNLVSPTPYIPSILRALEDPSRFRNLPVVYNTGGYERAESLRALKGQVQVYLPDLKYFDSALSRAYSGAEDYFPAVCRAIDEMVRQTGPVRLDADGMMTGGVMIRHLVLPGAYRDSMRVLEEIASRWGGDVWISLMSQYLPIGRAREIPALNRRITSLEYSRVTERAMDLGLTKGYMQARESSLKEYIPDFSYQGLR